MSPMRTILAMALRYRLGGVYGYRSISGWAMVAFEVASMNAMNDKRRALCG
jgi:hypothetical protein